MTAIQHPITDTTDREMIITRIFNARPEQVFEAWTSPEHLGHWFGPTGFTITTQYFDFKPGGEWRFIMHGPDGIDYPNEIAYREIEKPHRVVYTQEGGAGNDVFQHHITVTFAEENGGTRLIYRMVFPTVEQYNRAVKEYGLLEIGGQTFDRLAGYLEES